ncbi:sarcosine oxidase subunit gamma [Saccharopolyspora lacisalsi]|uniref:Sarcosine oxidase subunit gamma n=1 Tax=Halosaccharopolyspora lacisalsi TaxID=1000566 RepID=A0A839E2F0_9PSEU|nr:sarcosine oxidase subunit gamma family protein [Halosaccharopolyspora lacisalsi]MBA8825915.1 sarcosine oxidase subunit gamma [Halosaccharopolyspora lacisalsi]
MTVLNTVEPATGLASLRRSPLADRAAEFAASSADGLRGVRLSEEAFLTQVNLRVPPESPALLAGLERELGLALPHRPNSVVGDERDAVLWLGPDEWLVIAPEGRADRVVSRARTAMADSVGSSVDVSADRTTVRLAGPVSRDVLEKVCSLDLHPRAFGAGQCARTLVGRVRVALWQVGAEPAYRLLVHCSFAGYLADLLLDAMAEFTHA